MSDQEAERIAQALKNAPVKVGDIFYCSWGYEQTNYDFLKVVSVSPSGKSAICRKMSQRTLKQESLAEWIEPNQEYGDVFRMKIIEDHLRGSYPFADGGSGRLDSFFKWEGKPVFQTHYH